MPIRLPLDRPTRRALRRAGLALLIGAAAAGCSIIGPREQVRGNMVDLDSLKQLVPGTSTRADATALLGSPTAKASFDDNRWIYIGEVTQPRIASTQAVLKQEVVVLTFDAQGVLRDVKRLNEDNALPVNVVARTTPTPGGEAGFFQQLFGNVGRFGPGIGALGTNTGPAGTLMGTSP